MSLVHQALRKAEAEKQRKTGPIPPPAVAAVTVAAVAPQPTPYVTPPPSAKSSSWLLPTAFISLAAVAIVAIVVIVLRTTPTVQPTREVAAVAAPQPVRVPEVVRSEPAPSPVTPPTPEPTGYKLTGITKDPAGNDLAIINGSLRGVNEYVDGAVIKKIERDRVTLEVDGRETVVRLF